MKKIKNLFLNYDFLIILSLVTIYSLFFSAVCILKYNTFDYKDYDLAIHAQQIWNILHGNFSSSIVLGMKILGGPLWLIDILIAPIYKIFPSAITLLVLQSLLIGLGAWPLFLLAKNKLGRWLAFYITVAYLLYPALWFVNLFEYHELALVIPFLLFSFYYLTQEKYFKFSVFILLSILCKADVALVIFMIGIYALFDGRSAKWFATPLLISIFWIVVGVFIIIPIFRSSSVKYEIYYARYGNNFPEIAKNMILHPSLLLKYLWQEQNLVFLFQLFVPLGFLSFFAQKELMILSLPLIQHLSSVRFSEHTIYYHYTAPIIPFVFISAIYGLSKIINSKIFLGSNRRLFGLFLVSICLFSNIKFGPILEVSRQLFHLRKQDLQREIEKIIKVIPSDAAVISTFEYLPRLSNREYLYSFHNVYWGKLFPSSAEPFQVPEHIEYALVNFIDPLMLGSFKNEYSDIRMRDFITKYKFGIIHYIDNVVLFKKGITTDNKLFEVKKIQIDTVPIITVENSIEFLDYSLSFDASSPRILNTVYTFGCRKQIQDELWMLIHLVDGKGNIIYKHLRPICYGVYPTQRWQVGEVIQDHFRMLIPKEIKKGKYSLKMLLFSAVTGKIPQVSSSLSGNFDQWEGSTLSEIELLN